MGNDEASPWIRQRNLRAPRWVEHIARGAWRIGRPYLVIAAVLLGYVAVANGAWFAWRNWPSVAIAVAIAFGVVLAILVVASLVAVTILLWRAVLRR